MDGELLARTQPFSLNPPPFARQEFTEAMVTNRTPEARNAVLNKLRTLRNGGLFTPPSRQGTVLFPGMDGGGEWGGAAFDPDTGLLYVNANEMVWIIKLVDRPTGQGSKQSGRTLYNANCANCHREDRKGTPRIFQPSQTLGGSTRKPASPTSYARGAAGCPALHILSAAGSMPSCDTCCLMKTHTHRQAQLWRRG